MFECTCPLCQEGKYKGEDYYVDMSFLKKCVQLAYPDCCV